MPIFRVKSVKIYTGQKNLHGYTRGIRDELEVWHIHHYYTPSHTHRWTLSPFPPGSAAWALHFPTCRSFFNNLQDRWLGPIMQPLCSWVDGSHYKCLRGVKQKTTHVFCKVMLELILFLSFYTCLCYHTTNDDSWTLFFTGWWDAFDNI